MIGSGFKVKARTVYGGRNFCSRALSLSVTVFCLHGNVLYFVLIFVSFSENEYPISYKKGMINLLPPSLLYSSTFHFSLPPISQPISISVDGHFQVLCTSLSVTLWMYTT